METLSIDGIEITIAAPQRTSDQQVWLRDYYAVTSPALPPGVSVAVFQRLRGWTLTTGRPGRGWRNRRLGTFQEARDAAVRYVVNRAKEAKKQAPS